MPTIKLNDLDLFYEAFGRGETVLFLHSHFSRGLLAFAAQIQPFSGRYRCLYPDFRGHGRTRCDSLMWNSRMIADDMARFLDALGIPSAHLFGYSCGAYVGCYMAAKYPEKVKSLVTVGGSAYPIVDGADDFLPESLLTNGQTGFIEDIKARHFDAHRGDWRTYLRTTVADWKAHPSLTDDEWAAIQCPALFISGEHDRYGSCAAMKEKVPTARIYEVKGSGHRPHFVDEQAKTLNPMVLDFYRAVDGASNEKEAFP